MPKKCVPRPFLTSWSPLRVVQHSKSYPFATASLRKPFPKSPNFSKSLTTKQTLPYNITPHTKAPTLTRHQTRVRALSRMMKKREKWWAEETLFY